MLFPEEDTAHLKTWMVKRIENTSDADSDVLADYVIALLKHDGDQAAVRSLCEEEIPDFLTEDPKSFLNDVFQAITYKSYMPGAPPAPKIGSTTDVNPAANLPRKPPNTRKRASDDSGDFQDNDSHPPQGERAYKQPRRGRRRNGGFSGHMPPYDMPNLPPFDPNNPLEALMRMQAMGMPFPGMPDYSGYGPGQQQRKRGRCRDFDSKGFCSRGSSCAYDHGQDSIQPDYSGYFNQDGLVDMAQMMSHGPLFFGDSPRGIRAGRGSRGGKKSKGGKGAKGSRAPFSAEGPVNDRSKSTIVVENIPEESLSETEVRNFFMQFGSIQEVSMQPYKRLAIVKFDDWDSANAAYKSPKVVFDNRFVKVFWYKEVTDRPGQRSSNLGADASAGGFSRMEDSSQVEEIDVEEFQRRQEEAQRIHNEKESKRSELELQRQGLEKQQQELLAKHRVETEKLQAKLLAKSAASGDGDGATDENGMPNGSTSMLRAKLALLEQEAKILGIDPENPDPEDDDSNAGGFRGGYRGRGPRGRGAYSRGGYVSRGRGGRGSFRGTESRHAAYAQYSIDNRPKKVSINGVDFTAPEKDEALRHFLLSNGDFESVESGTEKTTVSFQDRKTAEKFYFTLQGKELPGVPGKLELSWISTPLPPVPIGATSSTAAGPQAVDKAALETGDVGDDFDATGDGADGQGGTAASRQDELQREVNMDYEMPDDEAW